MAPKQAPASAAPAGPSGNEDVAASPDKETLAKLEAVCAGLNSVLEAVDELPTSGTPIPASAQARVKKYLVEHLDACSSVLSTGGLLMAMCPRPADIQTLQQLRTVLAQRTPSWTVSFCNTEPLVGAAAQLVVDAASQAARQQLIEKNSSKHSLLLDEAHRAGVIAQAAAALRVVLSIRVLTHQQLVRVLAIAATAMTKSCSARSPEDPPAYGVCAAVAWHHLQPFYTGSSSGSSGSSPPWPADTDVWVVLAKLVQLSSSCLNVTLVDAATQGMLTRTILVPIQIGSNPLTSQGAAAVLASLLTAALMQQAGTKDSSGGSGSSAGGASSSSASGGGSSSTQVGAAQADVGRTGTSTNSSTGAAAASTQAANGGSSSGGGEEVGLPLPRAVRSMDAPLDDCPLLQSFVVGCVPLLRAAAQWPDVSGLAAAVKHYVVAQVNGPALGDNVSVSSSSGLPDSATRRTIAPRYIAAVVDSQAMVQHTLGASFSRVWQHLTAPSKPWEAVAQLVAEQLQRVVREQMIEKKSAEYFVAVQAAVAAGRIFAGAAMLHHKLGITLTTEQQLRSALIITREAVDRHLLSSKPELLPHYDAPATGANTTAAHQVFQMLLEVAASPSGVFVNRDTSTAAPAFTLGSGGIHVLRLPACGLEVAWQVLHGLGRSMVDTWECEGVLTKLRVDAQVASSVLGEAESREPVSEADLRSLRAQLQAAATRPISLSDTNVRNLTTLTELFLQGILGGSLGLASSSSTQGSGSAGSGSGSQQGAGVSTAQDGGSWGTGTTLSGLAGLFGKSAKTAVSTTGGSSINSGACSSSAAAADSANAQAAHAEPAASTTAAATATATATSDSAAPAASVSSTAAADVVAAAAVDKPTAAAAGQSGPANRAAAAEAGKSAAPTHTGTATVSNKAPVGRNNFSSSTSRSSINSASARSASQKTDLSLLTILPPAVRAMWCSPAMFSPASLHPPLDNLNPTELQQLKQSTTHGWNALHYACAAHRHGLVKQLLDIGMPVNEPEGVFGLLPLHLACMGKIQDAAQFTRLQACASFIELLDYTSKAKGGACLDLVMLLLDHGALIAPTKRLPTSSKFVGLTPLHLLAAWSAGGNNITCNCVFNNPFVSKVVSSNLWVDPGFDSVAHRTALSWAVADLEAAATGSLSLNSPDGGVARFLAGRSWQDPASSSAECPAHFDLDADELRVGVEHLCAAHAVLWRLSCPDYAKELCKLEVGVSGETPLLVAASFDNAAMVHMLLSAGADAEQQRLLDGARALDIAADKALCIVGWTLLCQGALAVPEWEWSSNKRPRQGVGEPLPGTNCTPDVLVCNAVQCDHHPWNLRFLERLLSDWVPLEGVWPETGETPLLMAIEYQDVDMVRLLVAAGADVNATVKDKPGNTALAQVVLKGASKARLEILQILIDAGAEFHSWISPSTTYDLVQTAANNRDLETVLKLVEAGAKWKVPAGQRVVENSLYYPPDIIVAQRNLPKGQLSYIEGRFRLAEKMGRQKRAAIAAAFERWVDSSVTPACRDATLRTLHAANITPGKPGTARKASAPSSQQPVWLSKGSAAEAGSSSGSAHPVPQSSSKPEVTISIDQAADWFAVEEAADAAAAAAAAASASSSNKQKKKKKLTALQKEAQRKEQQRVKMLEQKLQQGGSGSESDSDAGSSRDEQAGPSQAQQPLQQEQQQEEEEEPPQPVQQKAPKAKQQQKQDKQQQKKDKQQQKQVQRAERQRQQQQGRQEQSSAQPVASPPQPHAQAASAGAAVARQAAAPSSPPQAAAAPGGSAVAAVAAAAPATVRDSQLPPPQPAPAAAGGLPFLPPHLRATMHMSSPGGAAAAGSGSGGGAMAAAAVTASQPRPPPAAQQQHKSVAEGLSAPMPEVPAAMMALLAGSAQQRGMGPAQQSSSTGAAQHGARAKAAAGKRPVPQAAASGHNTQTTQQQQQQVHGQHSKQQQQKQQQRQAHVPSNDGAAAGDGADSKGPKLCVVCSTRRRNVLLIPCSHLVLCDVCADVDGAGISSCPHCGKACKQRIRVHKS